jgi:hypothetical protein
MLSRKNKTIVTAVETTPRFSREAAEDNVRSFIQRYNLSKHFHITEDIDPFAKGVTTVFKLTVKGLTETGLKSSSMEMSFHSNPVYQDTVFIGQAFNFLEVNAQDRFQNVILDFKMFAESFDKEIASIQEDLDRYGIKVDPVFIIVLKAATWDTGFSYTEVASYLEHDLSLSQLIFFNKYSVPAELVAEYKELPIDWVMNLQVFPTGQK